MYLSEMFLLLDQLFAKNDVPPSCSCGGLLRTWDLSELVVGREKGRYVGVHFRILRDCKLFGQKCEDGEAVVHKLRLSWMTCTECDDEAQGDVRICRQPKIR